MYQVLLYLVFFLACHIWPKLLLLLSNGRKGIGLSELVDHQAKIPLIFGYDR